MPSLAETTARTLELIKGVQADILKATFSQGTGLVNYDLEGPAKTLYPVLTPLRNKLPRVKSTRGDTATRWKAITGINTAAISAGVAEGHRGGSIAVSVIPYTAAYAGIGLEDSVTWESELAAEGFDDVKARAVESLLRALMLQEEFLLRAGNASLAFGTTPTPVAAVTTGGSLTSQAGNLLYVCALSAEGYANSSVAGGLPGQISRTNKDNTVDTYGGGNAKVSAASNAVTTSSGNQTITGSCVAVPGAAGYAWYLGTSAATAALAAITTTNTVTIGANPTGTQFANDAKVGTDYSQNALVFDGLITQCCKAGSNGYFASLDGGTLTSDGASGIVQIDTALKSFWDNYRLSPTEMWVSSQEIANINKKVLGAGGAPLFRFNLDAKEGGGVQNLTTVGGSIVGSYLNKYSMAGGQLLPIKLHPNATPGTVLFVTDELPYPLSNVTNVNQVKVRREYNQTEWPLTTREYQYGVYADEVLQCFAPFSLGVIANIANG